MFEVTPDFSKYEQYPVYQQIYFYIREEIQSGKLQTGTPLPSYRKLAEHLQVSKNTVELAYQQLIAEGYVKNEPRKRLVVLPIEELFRNFPSKQTFVQKKLSKQTFVYTPEINFDIGKNDMSLFPLSTWRKYTLQTLTEYEENASSSGHGQGELGLREEISKYLYESRGVTCSLDQIIIGASTQYLLYLLFILLKTKHYAMENPGYDKVQTVLNDLGARVSPVDIDEGGLTVDKLYTTQADVVYVTPSHQFPMGMVMPITRRIELLEWATSTDGYIIEDDYDSEYRYVGRPIPSLHSLDSLGRVIYLGTFSKSLLPSIRLSYMVLPPKLLEIFQERESVYSQTVSNLHQKTVELFMKNGHWNRHLNKTRTLYRKKHDILTQTLQQQLGDNLEVFGDHSGVHIVIRLQTNDIFEKLQQKGVKIYPIAHYFSEKNQAFPHKEEYYLLGYSGLSLEQIQKGVQIIRECI